MEKKIYFSGILKKAWLPASRAFHYLAKEEKRHSRRVGRLAERLSKEIGMPKKYREYMNSAGHYHKIGEILIEPDLRIAEKELDGKKKHVMMLYPIFSADILRNDPRFKSNETVTKAVMYHCEWFDGNGYPLNIRGYDIPLGARIIKVCNDFDASYKERSSMDECMREMLGKCGKEYDPELVEILFLRVLTDKFLKELYGK